MTNTLPYQDAGMDLLRPSANIRERLEKANRTTGRAGLLAAIRDVIYARAAEPARPEGWRFMASRASELGDHSAALYCFQRYFDADRSDPNRAYQYTYYLIAHGRDDAALPILRRLIKRAPTIQGLHMRLSVALAHMGEFEEAQALLRSWLVQKPYHAEAWYQLTAVRGISLDDGPAMRRLKDAAMRVTGKNDREEACLEFALGTVHDQAKDYDQAFRHFHRANAIMAELQPFDIGKSQKFFDAYRAGYNEAFVAETERLGRCESARPIFIAGSARSGTTLLERLLSAHSGVAGGGELTSMNISAYAMDSMRPGDLKPPGAPEGAPSIWRAVGDLYVQIASERFGPEGRIVDKAINLAPRAGLLVCGFSKAPLLWTRRDPRDVALSIFQRNFNDLNWCWSMESIAARLIEVEKNEAHFTALEPDRHLIVPYESLAADPSDWVGRILSHCGLSREPVEDTFHQEKKAVATASAASVREPISTKSIGSWKNYEKHLEPFLEAYQALGGRETL